MQLPSPRGELSEALFAALRSEPTSLAAPPPLSAVVDDDFQAALWVLQELAFRRIQGVDPAWEDEPSLLALRSNLERHQEAVLRETLVVPAVAAADAPAALVDLIDRAEGASLSSWVESNATIEHLREFVTHRAAYQLKEADPHSFAIPRLAAGRAKAAVLEIQLEEYGRAEPTEAHAELFRATMLELCLDPHGGADIDRLPAVTLRTNTVLNGFTRSRRLLGALLGHLAVFEMTSVEPMARYAVTCRRLLPTPAATRAARFYDVHVAADGLHERLARDEMIAGFADEHPDETDEVLFGAASLMAVEADLTRHLLTCWEAGSTSLRQPLELCVLGPGRLRDVA